MYECRIPIISRLYISSKRELMVGLVVEVKKCVSDSKYIVQEESIVSADGSGLLYMRKKPRMVSFYEANFKESVSV